MSLLNSDDLGEWYTIRVENIGEEKAEILNVADSQYFFGGDGYSLPPAGIEEVAPQDLPSLFDDSKKTFFQSVKTTCQSELSNGNHCEISFYLNLKKQFSSSVDNSVLFFDHQGTYP